MTPQPLNLVLTIPLNRARAIEAGTLVADCDFNFLCQLLSAANQGGLMGRQIHTVVAKPTNDHKSWDIYFEYISEDEPMREFLS